jgi:3-dehydroquinate synthase
VEADEFETAKTGGRALLNLGHTFGHAIEYSQGYGEWLHGEAVAAGMIMAAKLSGLDGADVQRLVNLVKAAGLPVAPPAIEAPDWQRAMGMDKKVKGKQLRFVLLRAIGDCYVTSDYDKRLLDSLTGAAA